MSLPYFYLREPLDNTGNIVLDEDTSRHIVQVLRMRVDEKLSLTDGKGNLFTARITDDHKKHCSVSILDTVSSPALSKSITIGISLLKNASRFEWFLEKATEIGVSGIVPLICDRTEKQKFRFDRMEQILVSAMIQSQQAWLPELTEPVKFEEFLRNNNSQHKLIAHCEDSAKNEIRSTGSSIAVLIGPEGDFTHTEIEKALKAGFKPVSLGKTRLRSETAGVVALTILNHIQ